MKNSKSGVALILVLLSLALLTVLSIEIIVASRVDIRIGRNARDRIQANYLAQSAARFALLRLQLYRNVRTLADGQAGGIPGLNNQTLEGIWSFPLPNLPLAGMDVKDWPGEFSSSIQAEGSKIPINMLDGVTTRGSSEEMAKSIRSQLEGLINGMLEDEEFDALYRGLKSEDLINPLEDWIDADSDSKSGGDEGRYYERLNPPYQPRNDRMTTLTELHMLENWTDDLVRRISPFLTVLNNSGKVNPNYISLERLKIFEPKLTPEELGLIQKKRMEAPFSSLDDLKNFIRTDPEIRNGKNFTFPEKLESYDKETVFYIKASGIVGELRRDLRLGIRFTEQKDAKKPSETDEAYAKRPGKLLEPQVLTVEEML